MANARRCNQATSIAYMAPPSHVDPEVFDPSLVSQGVHDVYNDDIRG